MECSHSLMLPGTPGAWKWAENKDKLSAQKNIYIYIYALDSKRRRNPGLGVMYSGWDNEAEGWVLKEGSEDAGKTSLRPVIRPHGCLLPLASSSEQVLSIKSGGAMKRRTGEGWKALLSSASACASRQTRIPQLGILHSRWHLWHRSACHHVVGSWLVWSYMKAAHGHIYCT